MRILVLAAGLVVLAGGAWTAAWFYAADQAGRAFESWIAEEGSQGRRWSCPDRAIRGYPLALEIACTNPTFAGLALGQQASGTLAHVRIAISPFDPSHARADLQAPLAYRSEDGTIAFTATWSRLHLDLAGLAAGVTGGTLSGSDLAARGRFGGDGDVTPHASTLEAALASVPAPDPTLDFSVALGGITVPLLDQALGGSQPVDATVSGRLTQAVFADTDTPAMLMDRWRQRGGSITFAAANFARGPTRVQTSGSLHLDAVHRIEGRLEAAFVGAGPILRRYGVNPNLVAAGSILNSLFGKRDPAAASPSDPGAIRLPLQFRDGRLGVGPVVTAIGLPALY